MGLGRVLQHEGARGAAGQRPVGQGGTERLERALTVPLSQA